MATQFSNASIVIKICWVLLQKYKCDATKDAKCTFSRGFQKILLKKMGWGLAIYIAVNIKSALRWGRTSTLVLALWQRLCALEMFFILHRPLQSSTIRHQQVCHQLLPTVGIVCLPSLIHFAGIKYIFGLAVPIYCSNIFCVSIYAGELNSKHLWVLMMRKLSSSPLSRV